jgi:hypothetical protein
MSPALKRLAASGRFVALVSLLRPDLPIPAALVNLQARHPPSSELPPASDLEQDSLRAESGDAVRGTPPSPSQGGGSSTAGGGGGVRPLNFCSNGCCDGNWTQNTMCPHPLGNTGRYQWYLFDYGWSIINSNGPINVYQSAVCSAIGNSTHTEHLSTGQGGTWSVLEGNFQGFLWYCSNPSNCFGIDTTVNTEANQHSHVYCGRMEWFL